jgi:hypothetical protein
MAHSYLRGHKLWFNRGEWKYCDNNQPIDNERPCKKCGQKPTKEGHDACLGKLKNVEHACCGHGVSEKYIILNPSKKELELNKPSVNQRKEFLKALKDTTK